MANYVQGAQIRLLEYGFQVNKLAQTLPATATATLFTVTGGRVVITSLIGTASTAIGATACNLSLGTAPTGGTANTAGITTNLALAAREVGTHFWLPAVGVANPLIMGANAGTAAQLTGGSAYVVQTGTVTWTTSATNTGALNWAMTYIPLDTGASVV
jgi:hypothetical protein